MTIDSSSGGTSGCGGEPLSQDLMQFDIERQW
jgi:hypothetical protein